MNCPICNVNLVMSDRNGVEIDYCPQCRGVWLDRGELDKIIEKSSNGSAWAQSYSHSQQHDNRSHTPQQQHKPHKKESFLSDLFDF